MKQRKGENLLSKQCSSAANANANANVKNAAFKYVQLC